MRIPIFFLIAILLTSMASAQVTQGDLNEMREIIMGVSLATYNNNPGMLENIWSPNADQQAKARMERAVMKDLDEFEHSITGYEQKNELVIVTTAYSAKGKWWSIKNQRAMFEFEKTGGEWKLLDANYHKNLNTPFIIKVIRSHLIAILGLAAIIGIGIYYFSSRKKPVPNTVNEVNENPENGKI